MKKFTHTFLTILLALTLVFASNRYIAFADEDSETSESFATSEEGENEGENAPFASKTYTAENLIDAYGNQIWPEAPEVISDSVYMVEANTGAVLLDKESDVYRYPASTTKLLTCLIALERCSMNEIVTFSETAIDLEDGASGIDAIAGEQLTMKDCLYGLMVASGNDCANAIAEHIGGSIEGFADIMNEKAAELGCKDSHFMNPHGLFHRDHYTTAYDMYLIANAAFNNSALCEIISHAEYTIPPTNKTEEPREIENTNYMINGTSAFYNENVVGGKTGYLPESGRTLVTLSKKNGLSIITVLMFCTEYNGVFADTQELLDYVFNNFSLNNISESEKRFQYASSSAQVVLDPTAQILMPSAVPLSSLTSDIEFAYDMTLDEFNEASDEAGIQRHDGRHLYARINYHFADHYLGKVNVYTDDNLSAVQASFGKVVYINIWLVLALAVVVVIILLLLARLTRARKMKPPKKRTKVIDTENEDFTRLPKLQEEQKRRAERQKREELRKPGGSRIYVQENDFDNYGSYKAERSYESRPAFSDDDETIIDRNSFAGDVYEGNPAHIRRTAAERASAARLSLGREAAAPERKEAGEEASRRPSRSSSGRSSRPHSGAHRSGSRPSVKGRSSERTAGSRSGSARRSSGSGRSTGRSGASQRRSDARGRR